MANMFDENGNYIKTEWKPGDRIAAGKLNKIEDALEAINNNDIERHKEADERLDALEEQNEAVEERFDELEDLVADNKSEVEVLIYENNVKMDRLEQEINDGIDTVEAIAHTVDDKIADADASMKAQVAEAEDIVDQGKADINAIIDEVEKISDLEAINTQLTYKASRLFITPEEFGAKGEIGVDDKSAFNNMFDYARANKKDVYLNSGKTYYCNGELVASDVSIYGSNGTTIYFNCNSNKDGKCFGWGGENVTIDGVTFNLNNSGDAEMQGLYNQVCNVKNQRFTNNTVITNEPTNTGLSKAYGVWVNSNGIKNLIISNNYFENIPYPIQINQQDGLTGSIKQPLGDQIDDVFIRDNIIINHSIGVNTPHVYCNNVHITGNRINTNQQMAINIAHVNTFYIKNNYISSTADGNDGIIHIEDCSSNGYITDNVINSYSTMNGINILNHSGVSKDDFNVNKHKGFIIENNTLNGQGYDNEKDFNLEKPLDVNGILVLFGDSVVIKNNSINNFSKGITCIQGSEMIIAANTFRSINIGIIMSMPSIIDNIIGNSFYDVSYVVDNTKFDCIVIKDSVIDLDSRIINLRYNVSDDYRTSKYIAFVNTTLKKKLYSENRDQYHKLLSLPKNLKTKIFISISTVNAAIYKIGELTVNVSDKTVVYDEHIGQETGNEIIGGVQFRFVDGDLEIANKFWGDITQGYTFEHKIILQDYLII